MGQAAGIYMRKKGNAHHVLVGMHEGKTPFQR
jgi:hypothetical protein